MDELYGTSPLRLTAGLRKRAFLSREDYQALGNETTRRELEKCESILQSGTVYGHLHVSKRFDTVSWFCHQCPMVLFRSSGPSGAALSMLPAVF